jgi:hypothetical protein
MTTGFVSQAAVAEQERRQRALPCRLFSGRLIGGGVGQQTFERQRLGTCILAVARPLFGCGAADTSRRSNRWLGVTAFDSRIKR